MAKNESGNGLQVKRLRAQRAVLAEFGRHAFRSRDFDELLNRATRLVSEALEVNLVKVLEHLPERGEMLVRAGVNWDPGVVGEATMGDDESSPGGYALLKGAPVISEDTAKETRFEIPRLLIDHGVKSMVNVVIAGEGRPFGVLEVDAQDHRQFDEDDVEFLTNYANLLAHAIDRARVHQELEQRVRHQDALAQESRHRVQNILALVQALAVLMPTEGRSASEFREGLVGRIRALGRTHDLMFENEQERHLDKLLKTIAAPHLGDRIEALQMSGVSPEVTEEQALRLGLVLHELCTNSTKYGALSMSTGHIDVDWSICHQTEGDRVQLRWQERGGPVVVAPERFGLGTQLIQKTCIHQLRGGAEISYAPEGLVCELWFPLGSQRQ